MTPLERAARTDGRWQDADGHWWMSGNVRDDGVIVGNPGQFIASGVVWIDARLEAEAAKHGWATNGVKAQDGTLVQVVRP